MKKFYLIILGAAFSLAAGAQELTFYNGNTPIENGSTINFTDIDVEDYGDYKEVQMAPDLYIGTDLFSDKINIRATCTSGQKIQLCAGGNCVKGETVTKSNVTVQTNQKQALKFDYVAELDADVPVPVVTTLLEAWIGNNEADAKSFTIVMGQSTGVTVIENDLDFVCNGDGIAYNTDETTSFILVNTEGQKVLEIMISGSGVISTSSLQPGIYVYRAGNKSGRIYLR